MPPDAKTIHDMLSGLAVEDRLAALLITIIETNPNALAVSLRMVRVTTTISKDLSPLNKFKVGEAMRDAADRLEQDHAVHIGSD
jgi:hypothetical protein